MAVVFDEIDSVFFLGGTGTKAGIANPGGCTQAWFDANFTVLTDIMGADGAALVAIVNGEPEPDNKTMTKAGECGNVEAGMVAYLSGTNVVNGRYRVVSATANTIVFPDNTFAIGGGWVDDLVCNVGGAWDGIQNAADNVDGSNGYNVKVSDNVNKSLGATIDFDTGGGSVAKNSQTIFEAFWLVPGDMCKGGDYYQGPMDCLKNGVDTTKCITFDGNHAGRDIISIVTYAFTFKNYYFYDTSQAANFNGVELSNMAGSPKNLSFINCKWDACYYAIKGTVYGSIFEGCYFGDDMTGNTTVYMTAIGTTFENCVINGHNLFYGARMVYGHFVGCLFYQGLYGLYCSRSVSLVDCIFYGQSNACIGAYDATYSCLFGRNNIFMPYDITDNVLYSPNPLGSVSQDALKNSCVWTIAGAAMNNHISINGISRQLSNAIDADPLFVDAPNYDFRLQVNSPCLNAGLRTFGGING